MAGQLTETTLCYIEKDGKYLMLHRVKKEHDASHGKWIGVGGHVEADETPEQCVRREVTEETGLVLGSCDFRGIVDFYSDEWEDEKMYLYTSSDFSGILHACDEGDLKWIPKPKIPELNLWEGDRIFLSFLQKDIPPFHLEFHYKGDALVSWEQK